MKSKTDLLKILKKSKSILNDKFGIEELGLFGSYSIGKNTFESDIDIIYLLNENKKMGILEMHEFEKFMKEILGEEKLDLVNKKYLNPVIELEIEDSLIYV